MQQNNHPFGTSTVEFANNAHYNSHPQSLTIGHWITASAFLNYGNTSRFSDPGSTRFTGASQVFEYNTDTFVNTWVQTNGITW